MSTPVKDRSDQRTNGTNRHDSSRPVGVDEEQGLREGDSAEIARVIAGAYASARSVIDSHRSHLDRLAARLVERETLEADDLEVVLAGVNRRAAVSGQRRDRRRQAGRGRSGVDGTQSAQPTTYLATERAKEFFGLGAALSASPDHNGRY